MKLGDQYTRAGNWETVARDLHMRRAAWRVLFALEGKMSGQQVADLTGASAERIPGIMRELVEHGLVVHEAVAVEHAVVARQSVTRTGTGPAAVNVSPLIPQQSPRVTSRFANEDLSQTPDPDFAQEQEPAHSEEVEDDAPVFAAEANGHLADGGVLLKPIIDYIQNLSGPGTLGQLTVYRVFLKVPPGLLKDARIQSVKFVDDNFRIENVELLRAIREAVKKTLRKELPKEILPV